MCGNSIVETGAGEQCDDGNTTSGDGCSATCQDEKGWFCPSAGEPCIQELYCGDGIVTPPEQCDDGNGVPGDGCSGTCQIEPNYLCAIAGQPCQSTIVCGDGVVEANEACDDGDTTGNNGCAADCSQVTAGWTCPNTGGACTMVPIPICGDGIIDSGEQCDDGNMSSNDGCSSSCVIETGYSCPTPGMKCTLVEYCGNGVINYDIGETCDDGNAMPGDGCSASCQIEPNFKCPMAGQACVSIVVCGDGKVEGSEQCDDGNTTPNDGCSATCTLEAGWTCPHSGLKCVAKSCGDGIQTGAESCDLGIKNGTGIGCTATCTVQTGWNCLGNVCTQAHCGNGTFEPPAEECDDGNLIPYDGCSPQCTIEPKCASGQCTAVCGDGLVFGTEQCDDGNTNDGDGCDHNCLIESGWSCTNANQTPASTLTIPILYRDMHYYNTFLALSPGAGHPDFQNYNHGVETNLVKSALGADGEPVFNKIGNPQSLTNATDFCWWYHETGCNGAGSTNPFDSEVFLDTSGNPTTLTLTETSPNVYSYSNDFFFPVDNLGWNASGSSSIQTDKAGDNIQHNFSFTSELHYPFTYDNTTQPTFSFDGDDDVWVFINGQLVVDIGGVHGKTPGSVQLTNSPAGGEAATLGLTNGGMYSIDVFQAERHTTASTYGLTLSGFTHTVSTCAPICGDGIIEGSEVCDDGVNNGMYGSCSADCSVREPYCGDDLQNGPEQCDDGNNIATYGGTMAECAPGCVIAPYCGDATVQAPYGEQCDLGTAGNTGAYNGCTSTCKLGPHCGDNIKNGAEQCDDGVNNGAADDPCAANCTLKCGNGVVDTGEQCDNGTANNTGGYGKCNPNCTLGARCGDGVKNGAEQCDNGTNNGSYGTCDMDCTLAPYCGDGVVSGPEQCDNGAANSVTAYGQGQCTAACEAAPYCGDGIVEAAFGEQCDGSAGCTNCQYIIQ